MSDEPPVFPDMEGADRDPSESLQPEAEGTRPDSGAPGFPPAPPVTADPKTAEDKAAARKFWWTNFLLVFVSLSLFGLSLNTLAEGYLLAFIMIIVSTIQNGLSKTAKGKRGAAARLAASALAFPALFMMCIGQLSSGNSGL